MIVIAKYKSNTAGITLVTVRYYMEYKWQTKNNIVCLKKSKNQISFTLVLVWWAAILVMNLVVSTHETIIFLLILFITNVISQIYVMTMKGHLRYVTAPLLPFPMFYLTKHNLNTCRLWSYFCIVALLFFCFFFLTFILNLKCHSVFCLARRTSRFYKMFRCHNLAKYHTVYLSNNTKPDATISQLFMRTN